MEKNLVALAYYAGSWIFSRYLGRENCYPIITVTQPQQHQLNNEAYFFLFPLNTQKIEKPRTLRTISQFETDILIAWGD